MKQERLDKLLTGTGLFTRSRARTEIQSGAVSVDGIAVRKPETKVSRDSAVTVRGETLDTSEYLYCMMNKPAGYVCSAKDEGGYPSVLGLLPEHLRRRGLFCVGRLDADVTGLLLLTDDGAYAHRVASPRGEIPKRYEIHTDGPLGAEDAEALKKGVTMKDGTVYRPALLESDPDSDCHGYITVTEGKYHEVKNLVASRGLRVTAMSRLSIGALVLDKSLEFGQFHYLTEEQADQVFI